MPAPVLSAIPLIDADGSAIGLNSVNRFEKLLVQFFDLLLSGNLFFFGRFRLCDDSLLLLDGVFHLAVFLVHRIGEILDTEHIAVVGEGEAIHAIFLAFLHQIRHFRHAIEHGIMRMDVQMREMLRHIVSDFRHRFLLHFLIIEIGFNFDSCWLNHIGIGGFEVGNELGINAQVIFVNHAATNQFEENTRRSLHISGSIVRRVELLAKQDLVDFFQFRELELTIFAARKLAKLGGFLRAGVNNLPTTQRVLATAAQKLAAQHIEVEFDVMPDQIFGFGRRLHENIQHLIERFAVFHGVFGGDAMHHFGCNGNLKALWLNEIVMVFHEAALVVVDLPSQLHHTRPVVEIGQRSVVYFWETRGLCIED